MCASAHCGACSASQVGPIGEATRGEEAVGGKLNPNEEAEWDCLLEAAKRALDNAEMVSSAEVRNVTMPCLRAHASEPCFRASRLRATCIF